MNRPWVKWFWRDWETDPALKLCSLAAQGLWMRMLCIAASHDPIGIVAVAGKGLSETDIARMTGASESEVSILLGELLGNGVCSRDAKQRIYSRRMIRDARIASEARKNGKKGGNPTLCKDRGKTQGVNPSDKAPVKGGVKPNSHKPEYSDTNVSGAQAPDEDPVKRIFDTGIAILVAGGSTVTAARSLVGKWRRDFGDEALLSVLGDAGDKTDPKAWIPKALTARPKAGASLSATADRYRKIAGTQHG